MHSSVKPSAHSKSECDYLLCSFGLIEYEFVMRASKLFFFIWLQDRRIKQNTEHSWRALHISHISWLLFSMQSLLTLRHSMENEKGYVHPANRTWIYPATICTITGAVLSSSSGPGPWTTLWQKTARCYPSHNTPLPHPKILTKQPHMMVHNTLKAFWDFC